MLKENRKNYHHGDLKRALVEAGLAELEEKGLESLSLRPSRRGSASAIRRPRITSTGCAAC
jgi:hypothetical protein